MLTFVEDYYKLPVILGLNLARVVGDDCHSFQAKVRTCVNHATWEILSGREIFRLGDRGGNWYSYVSDCIRRPLSSIKYFSCSDFVRAGYFRCRFS